MLGKGSMRHFKREKRRVPALNDGLTAPRQKGYGTLIQSSSLGSYDLLNTQVLVMQGISQTTPLKGKSTLRQGSKVPQYGIVLRLQHDCHLRFISLRYAGAFQEAKNSPDIRLPQWEWHEASVPKHSLCHGSALTMECHPSSSSLSI